GTSSGGGTNAQSLTAGGEVTDARTLAVISGALVDIPLQTSNPNGNTGTDGKYSLTLPNSGLPQFLVGTVNKTDYLPGTVFFKYANGQLQPLNTGSNNSALILIRPDQDLVFLNGLSVVHLGDAKFGGTANSQLQVQAAGLIWNESFRLTAAQQAKYTTLTVTLYGRGIESGTPTFNCDQIGLGNNIDATTGKLTDGTPQTLTGTAADGSFTKITHTFSLNGLAADADAHLQIVSGKACASGTSTDYDDFEIVAVTGELN
ncbi:MAG: hypothetical protein ABIP64_17435, partial [Burkholderiales bacterium]